MNDNLKEKLMAEIKTGEVTMRPRAFFMLRAGAVLLAALAALAVSIFIFNFISFHIRIAQHDALLHFGPRGIMAFFWFFPWHLLAIDFGLILVLQHLLRGFRAGYRVPILYLAGGLLALTLAFGLALDALTPLNDRLADRAERLPPPMRMIYIAAKAPPPPGSGLCRCAILSIDGNVLTVQDTRAGTTTLTVVLPPDDPRATTTLLSVGDVVMIAGTEENGVIEAFGVRKAPLRGPGAGMRSGGGLERPADAPMR